ncbi:MAG: alkaline phosphatase family protein [Bacillota bacterium]|nr:alkaline phosphatase family protein [Bacillota bacterium]
MSERRAGRNWRWLLLVLVPLLLLGVSVGAAMVALGLQADLDAYRPVDVGPLAGGEGSVRLAGRVLVVVVDGLRVDTSRQMPFVESLRGRGAWTTLTTGQPSFSKPGYAVLSTGSWQEYHGVTMNSHPGHVDVETIFTVARQAGLRTALFGYTYWGEINPAVDEGLVGDYPDHELYARARASLEAGQNDLTYVHLSAADTAAHEGGGALAQEYLEAARDIDGMIAGLASCLDLSKDVLVVTADHGHLDRNNRGGSGHGGWEPDVTTVPLVMVGAGVRQGEIPAGRQVDVVPTVATLLGVPAPAQSLGRVLWGALDVPEDVRADKEVKRAARLVAYARAYVAALSPETVPPPEAATATSGSPPEQAATTSGAPAEQVAGPPDRLGEATAVLEQARTRLSESSYAEAFVLAGESMARAERAMAAARSRLVWGSRWPRLPFLLVPLVILGLLIWKKRGPLLEMLAWGVAYLALYHVFYAWVFGDTYSLSVFPDGSLPTMWRLFGLPAYLALAIILVVVLWRGTATSRAEGRFSGRQQLVWLVEKAVLAPYVVLGLAVAAGLFVIGAELGSYLPPFRLNFLYFCALLQLLWLGPVALLGPLVTWLTTARRRPTSRAVSTPAADTGQALGPVR